MLAAIVLATTLRFTLPSANAAPGSCDPGAVAVPLDDLGWVQVVLVSPVGDTIWGQPRGVVGREGQRDSFVVELNGNWTAYVRTSDRTQPDPNWSCLSNPRVITGSAPLSAPGPVVRREEYFDLMGRKLRAPTRSGIYWRRTTMSDGSRVRRLVVLR